MPLFPPLAPLLADGDAVIGGIIFLITIAGWIVNLISSKNQKGPPVANRPRPPQRPRDEKLQQEINIFVEDSGAQRKKGAASRPAAPAGRPPAGQPPVGQSRTGPLGTGQARTGQPPSNRKIAASPTGRASRKMRPGESLASRPAPITDTLGTGVKQSLSQHMTDRVSQEVQQRLAPRVDAEVAADLGPTLTSGASMRAPPLPAAVSATLRADRFAELLRNPANVRQAIVLNLILSPPPARARTPRR
jgi:hypothetical protein